MDVASLEAVIVARTPMYEPQQVEESAGPWRGATWEDASDDALLSGAALTFRQRLAWNAEMVALWARWNPDLARRVWIDRESLP